MQSPAASNLTWLARSLEIVALATFGTLFFMVPDGATTWVLIANLAVFYALFFRAIAVPDRIVPGLPSYFSVEVLFLAFSYLIYYHSYQLYLIGATDLGMSRFVSNSFVDGSNKAITLATIGMLALTLGYRMVGQVAGDANAGKEPSSVHRIGYTNGPSQHFSAIALVSSALLLAIVALYLLAGWRSAGEGRYTGTTTQGLGIEGASNVILMLCMIVAALWVYATGARLRRPPILILGLLVAIAWTIRLLLLGDRSSFLLFVLVLVGGYFTFVRRASVVVLVAVFGMWMFVYNVIEVLRFVPNWYSTTNFWELLNNSREYQESSDESSFNIATMALRAAVETVPYNHDFTYGSLKVIQLATTVPFSGKVFLPYFDLDYTNSATMLGDIMLGTRAKWDPGTNVIADSYIDLGLPGVVIVLFVVGLSAKLIRNYVARDSGDVQRVVIYLLAMALFAILPRYAIDVPARTLVWALVFCTVVAVIAGRSRSRTPAVEFRPTERKYTGG